MRNEKGQFVKGEKRDFNVKGMLGKKHSKETIEKMKNNNNPGKFKKGQKSWNKGTRGIMKAWNKGVVGKYKKKGGYTFGMGADNPNWKGGVNLEYEKIRKSDDWRKWREEVFIRDDYTCKNCDNIGGILHPHHIQNSSKYPEFRFVVNNGITLCEDCHKEFHYCYGTVNNTNEQLIEFLYE